MFWLLVAWIEIRLSCFRYIASGGPSSAMRSCGVVSERIISNGGDDLRMASIRPPPYIIIASISSGMASAFDAREEKRGSEGALENKVVLASGQDEPEKIAMDRAGPAAEEDSRVTKSAFSDQDWCLRGNENARPG